MTEAQIKDAQLALKRVIQELRNTAIANRIEKEFDAVTLMARDYIRMHIGQTNGNL